MIKVESREEAIEWAKRVPPSDEHVIEVRRVQEMEDFPEDVRKAATGAAEIEKRVAENKRR